MRYFYRRRYRKCLESGISEEVADCSNNLALMLGPCEESVSGVLLGI